MLTIEEKKERARIRKARWRSENPDKYRQELNKASERDKAKRANQPKKIKQYQGNHPSEMDGWVFVGDLNVIAGRSWKVYKKHSAESWFTVKVCCVGRRPSKANFWLSWNGDRMAKSKSYIAAIEYMPEIVSETQRLLEKA